MRSRCFRSTPRRPLQLRARCASISRRRTPILSRRYQQYADAHSTEALPRAARSRPRPAVTVFVACAQASGDLDSMESDGGYWVTTPSTLTPSPRSTEHAAHSTNEPLPPARPESARAPPMPLLAAWPRDGTELWTPRQAQPCAGASGSALSAAPGGGAPAGGGATAADCGSSSQLAGSSRAALSPRCSRDASGACVSTCYEAPRSVAAAAPSARRLAACLPSCGAQPRRACLTRLRRR